MPNMNIVHELFAMPGHVPNRRNFRRPWPWFV